MQQTTASMIKWLQRMTVGELRQKYAEVFGEECRSYNKDYLWKRIAWRIQADAEGGLSERARRRAEELACELDIRLRPPRNAFRGADQGSVSESRVGILRRKKDRRLPPPGTVLTRNYRGERIAVTVLSNGFEYEGTRYRSLSAVAKAITGSHWNGYRFFGLTEGNGKRKSG